MSYPTVESMARGASGSPLPVWLWVVVAVVFVGLAGYGTYRKRRD
ncbi:hypothetical protein [Streptomyces cellulosae]|uniref:Uncharacterized protein n=1 Tax=Streptomyces cellulosae TaxID=1968 RepID=A0ABW7Y640_STRCE